MYAMSSVSPKTPYLGKMDPTMPAIHGPIEEHGKNKRLCVCPLNCTRRASMIFFSYAQN